MRTAPTANPRPLGSGALVSALVIGIARSRLRRHVDPVPDQLFDLAIDLGKTEADYGQQYGGRLLNLVGAAGVALALVINLGKDVFARLRPDDPNKLPLDLGPVGEPVFVAVYLLAIVLLLASASVAVHAAFMGGRRGPRAARVSVDGLRWFGQNPTPMPQIRRHLYPIVVKYLADQRKLNEKRAKRVRRAGAIFAAAIFAVAVDAALLGVRLLGL